MATGLHAQNDGGYIVLQVGAAQTAQPPFKLQVSQFCAGSVLFSELSKAELHAQSDVHRTVVLDSIVNDKSSQKGTIPSSTVTQQKAQGNIQAEVLRLKKLQVPRLHPTKCSVDGWYSSNLSYKNIKSTEVTAHSVCVCARARVCKAFSTGPGSENSPKASVLNRQSMFISN